ncbi:hypothetical protein AGLY_001041 [Aphis glycines]|uniref:Uncharacterized protein n=1 Tax=Aphis glycines TaxID=307491 RepID=A0A6G0U8P7_APHGL|nr:hypothetical protein AGLY_001041 [Aphis glycines]
MIVWGIVCNIIRSDPNNIFPSHIMCDFPNCSVFTENHFKPINPVSTKYFNNIIIIRVAVVSLMKIYKNFIIIVRLINNSEIYYVRTNNLIYTSYFCVIHVKIIPFECIKSKELLELDIAKNIRSYNYIKLMNINRDKKKVIEIQNRLEGIRGLMMTDVRSCLRSSPLLRWRWRLLWRLRLRPATQRFCLDGSGVCGACGSMASLASADKRQLALLSSRM